MNACAHEFFWYLATNEDGWRCCHCLFKPGEPPGFDPKLDRELIDEKVGGILMDMHEAGLIYVSNGTGGDALTAMVAEQCTEAGVYDQYSIAAFILAAETASHAKYWQTVSEGILAGNDPRNRCDCGKLSTISSLKAGKTIYRCGTCDAETF